MKKIFTLTLTLGVILGACKEKMDNADNTNKNMVLVDTTGLYKNNVLTDVGNNKFVITQKPAEPIRKSTPRTKVNKSNTVYSSGVNTSTNAVYPQRDKGWSSAAKGTAIGGGAGAVLGAVISKNNRVQGGIIGAVLGAGAGYAIGRANDRKTGRVERTRTWKAAQNGY